MFGRMGTNRYLAPDPDDPMALPDLLRQAADVTQQHLVAVCRSSDDDRVRRVTPLDSLVLRRVSGSHAVTQVGLSEYLGVHETSVARSVRRLATVGLLSRHAHATDGRAAELAATGAGEDLAELMDSTLTDLVGEWVDDGVVLPRLGHELAVVGVDSGRRRRRGW